MLKIDKNFFESNGYIILKNIIDKKTLIHLNKIADLMIKDFKKGIIRNQTLSKNNRKHFGNISQKGKMFLGNQCEFYSRLNEYAKGKLIKNIVKKLLGKKVYLFNEQIVNKDSYKQGVVSEIKEEKVYITYNDGTTEWLEEGKVVKLLLDDGPSGTLLNG